MAKLLKRYITAKTLSKLVRRNPYVAGATTVLALAGLAVSASRNRRVRELTSNATPRLAPRLADKARLATATDPY
jgi:predicted HAD superfamily phosphohydrolase